MNQPLNGPDTTIQGFELAYQQTFARLPEPFDGLGVLLNYTFIDSADDFLNQLTGTKFGVLGLSENTYNVSVFYEKGRFSARVAYNHRDEFLEDLTDTRGHPQFVDAYEQWDASVKYHLNDKVTFSLEAINLTDENVTLYHVLGTGSHLPDGGPGRRRLRLGRNGRQRCRIRGAMGRRRSRFRPG